MARPAAMLARGLVTHSGIGEEAAVAALSRPPPAPEQVPLTDLVDALETPYLPVPGAPTDPEQRLAWLLDRSLEQVLAEWPLDEHQRVSIPLFIGSSCYGIGIAEARYRRQLVDGSRDLLPLPLDGFTQIGRHLRQVHGFAGADFAFNTACTATANALLAAVDTLVSGQAEYALVVGLEAINVTTLAGFQSMQLVASGGMKPFDRHRDGLVLGEGCSMILLGAGDKHESSLTLCGGASNCDTHSISAASPDGSSIARVMELALQYSGVGPDEIRAIKAHGTATPLNDDSEVAGMQRLFGDRPPPFFSLKAFLGHTLGSCGVMETGLTAACLMRGWLPASGGFGEPDPRLGLAPMATPARAGEGYYLLNFFGFGGNNCSLVMHRRSGRELGEP